MTDEGVERTLGRLSAQMDAIVKNLDRAEEKRGEIYLRLEEQGRTISELETDMKFVKPVAVEIRRMKMMGMGALFAVGLTGGALAVTLGDFFTWLARLMK